jgi:hypothetical protein
VSNDPVTSADAGLVGVTNGQMKRAVEPDAALALAVR